MSVIAKDDLYVAIIPEETFKEYFVGYYQEEYNETLKFLRSFTIFNSIGKKNLLKLKYCFLKQHLMRGDHLFDIGSKTDGVYFLYDGEFETFKYAPSVSTKTELQLNSEKGFGGNMIDLKKSRLH